MMRFALLLFLVAAIACGSPKLELEAGERVAALQAAFTSNEAVLVDFDFDGKLVADTNEAPRLRTLIRAQLMYAVGQLNGDRSNAQYERLDLSAITATAKATPDEYDVTYHAKLPVAWGGSTKPTAYELELPAKIGESDQAAFASKYGSTCVDASAGAPPIDAWRMFLFYRPQKADCTLSADDVVVLHANVSTSAANTSGKYPEYDLIWEDNVLDVVAVFSRSQSGTKIDDEGAVAYQTFVRRVRDYFWDLDPSGATMTSAVGEATVAVKLPDGRTLEVHARLVGSDLTAEGAGFDAWYDALTPRADVILYNGHAGLGVNISTLMKKGSFKAGKYLLWSVNGCDTFAYVDRTLADRRAILNPDDPGGTKYMDTISNVMAGYFETSPATSMTLLTAIVHARDPQPKTKTFREILADVDPSQVIVVTGEEDNVFAPKVASDEAATPPAPPAAAENDPLGALDAEQAPKKRTARCTAGPASPTDGSTALGGAAFALLALAIRRRSAARR